MGNTILIKNIRAVDAKNDMVTDVLIKDEAIESVGTNLRCGADEVIDGSDLVLMPSLFDMHVHFRDPGLTYKEDIHSGCRSALAGGVTGVVCIPYTMPP